MIIHLAEDFATSVKNKSEGISSYLNRVGRLWVTPYGPFNSLREIEIFTGLQRKTILRRLYSKKQKFQDWYIVDGDSPLAKAEECEQCDMIDDLLFEADCWLCSVYHIHGEEVDDEVSFTYLYKGLKFSCTLGEWNSGTRLHLEI